jgi:hypothetical protein
MVKPAKLPRKPSRIRLSWPLMDEASQPRRSSPFLHRQFPRKRIGSKFNEGSRCYSRLPHVNSQPQEVVDFALNL